MLRHVESRYGFKRLEFEVIGEHRFEPHLPLYMFLKRGNMHLHLSEHRGDAEPHSLVYMWVEDVDKVAKEFGVEIVDQPWGKEVQIVDPDGNRLRVATRK